MRLKARRAVASGERGQVLLLFVALFSVILAMGAFALDQGFWLSRHRQTQASADAAARAGALAWFAPVPAAGPAACDTAERAAAEVAEDNGFDVTLTGTGCTGPHSDTQIVSSSNCPGVGNDRRSMSVTLGQDLPSFFSGAFGIGGNDSSAGSVACVGTIRTFKPIDNGFEEYLPIYIQTDDNTGSPPDRRPEPSCLDSSGDIRFNVDCVIVKAQAPLPVATPPPDFPHRTGLFREPDDDECRASSGGFDTGWIEDGIDFTCRLHTSGSCNDSVCVRTTSFPTSASQHRSLIDAFEERLDDTPGSCEDFDEVFTRLQTTPSSSAVYAQRCASGRAAIIAIVAPGSGSERQVKGFAMAYIVGCFDQRNGSNWDDDCDVPSSQVEHYEVRARLLRAYVPGADAGDLGVMTISSSNPNTIYTIQTVE